MTHHLAVTHRSDRFITTYNPIRDSMLIYNVQAERSCYLRDAWTYRDALAQAPGGDHDSKLEWIWTNAGFHRMAQ